MTFDKENTSPNVIKRKAMSLSKMEGAFPRAYTPNDTLTKKCKASSSPALQQQLSPIPLNKRSHESASANTPDVKDGVLSYFKETTFTPLHKKIMHRVRAYESEANELFIQKARTPMRYSAINAAVAVVDTSLSFSFDRSRALDIDLSLSLLKEEVTITSHAISPAEMQSQSAEDAIRVRPNPSETQLLPNHDIEMHCSCHFDEDIDDVADQDQSVCAAFERFSLWASAYAAFTLTIVSVLLIAALHGTATLRSKAATPIIIRPNFILQKTVNSTLAPALFIPFAKMRTTQPKCNITDSPVVELYNPPGNTEFFIPISLRVLRFSSAATFSLPSPRMSPTTLDALQPQVDPDVEASSKLNLLTERLSSIVSLPPTNLLSFIMTTIVAWTVVTNAVGLSPL